MKLYYLDKFDKNNSLIDESTFQVIQTEKPGEGTTKYGYYGEHLSDVENHIVDIISIRFVYDGTKEISIASTTDDHNDGP